MPIDWGKLAQIAIPAGAQVIGAVAGTKAQTGAAQANRADIERAYQRATGDYGRASAQAGQLNQWALGQSVPVAGWGYQQGRSPPLRLLLRES